MGRAPAVPLLFWLLTPAAAFADGGAGFDLSTGVAKELLGTTTGVAWGLFGLCLVLALLVEAFGGSPGAPKNYGALAARALLVVALLKGYPYLFGSIVSTASGLASRLAPQAEWHAANAQLLGYFRQGFSGTSAAALPTDGAATGLSGSHSVPGFVGGLFFDSLVLLLALLGQAISWAFVQATLILQVLFYVLGPLALVFYIPLPRGPAGAWLKSFCTISCWPILASLLVRISTALMTSAPAATEATAAFGAICRSVLTIAMTLAVPRLASALVGGSVGNAISQGLSSAASLAGTAGAAAGALVSVPRAGAAALGSIASGALSSGAGPGVPRGAAGAGPVPSIAPSAPDSPP